MLRTVKPRTARSKRVLDAREPKEVEDARTAIFVKGTHAGEKASAVMKELMALKRPDAISFSKKNVIRPFEDTGSLEFLADKNDASLFIIGQSTKKRPDGLTWVRMYDKRVLDMVEMGIDKFVSMAEFKTPKSTPGHKPMMHFASELFETHPRFVQVKSLLMDFFNGQVVDSICLAGLEHVISVSLSPTPVSLNTASATADTTEDLSTLPKIHVRIYTIKLLASGSRVPRVELVPMGPFIDLSLRRHATADPEMWKQAMKRPKLKKQDVEKGLGKKRKNMEVDDMGDLRGRIHVKTQDLNKLQTRKMKGLKPGAGIVDDESGSDEGSDDEVESGRKRKKARAA